MGLTTVRASRRRPTIGRGEASFVPLADSVEAVGVLRIGLRRGYSGVLRIVSAVSFGRIYLCEGRIAWVNASNHLEHLGHVMARELGVPMHRLADAVMTCRESGLRLAPALAELGIASGTQLRECMRLHLGAHLHRVLTMDGDLYARFEIQPYAFEPDLTFSLESLIPPPRDEIRSRPTVVVSDRQVSSSRTA